MCCMAMCLYGLSSLGANELEQESMWAGGMHICLCVVHVALLMMHGRLQASDSELKEQAQILKRQFGSVFYAATQMFLGADF